MNKQKNSTELTIQRSRQMTVSERQKAVQISIKGLTSSLSQSYKDGRTLLFQSLVVLTSDDRAKQLEGLNVPKKFEGSDYLKVVNELADIIALEFGRRKELSNNSSHGIIGMLLRGDVPVSMLSLYLTKGKAAQIEDGIMSLEDFFYIFEKAIMDENRILRAVRLNKWETIIELAETRKGSKFMKSSYLQYLRYLKDNIVYDGTQLELFNRLVEHLSE